jgi:hypothetical protein
MTIAVDIAASNLRDPQGLTLGAQSDTLSVEGAAHVVVYGSALTRPEAGVGQPASDWTACHSGDAWDLATGERRSWRFGGEQCPIRVTPAGKL